MFCSRTQRSDYCEAKTPASLSRVKHSTTEPLRSLLLALSVQLKIPFINTESYPLIKNNVDPDQLASVEAS